MKFKVKFCWHKWIASGRLGGGDNYTTYVHEECTKCGKERWREWDWEKDAVNAWRK